MNIIRFSQSTILGFISNFFSSQKMWKEIYIQTQKDIWVLFTTILYQSKHNYICYQNPFNGATILVKT